MRETDKGHFHVYISPQYQVKNNGKIQLKVLIKVKTFVLGEWVFFCIFCFVIKGFKCWTDDGHVWTSRLKQ